jgi:hypothetical protein
MRLSVLLDPSLFSKYRELGMVYRHYPLRFHIARLPILWTPLSVQNKESWGWYTGIILFVSHPAQIIYIHSPCKFE